MIRYSDSIRASMHSSDALMQAKKQGKGFQRNAKRSINPKVQKPFVVPLWLLFLLLCSSGGFAVLRL